MKTFVARDQQRHMPNSKDRKLHQVRPCPGAKGKSSPALRAPGGPAARSNPVRTGATAGPSQAKPDWQVGDLPQPNALSSSADGVALAAAAGGAIVL